MTNSEDFRLLKPFFPQEYFVYYHRENGTAGEKTRCLGVLTVFRFLKIFKKI